MLTREELDRLSRVETVIIEPGHWNNCSPEQFQELVQAARAWELYAKDRALFTGCRWTYIEGRLITEVHGHETPQSAVLAALEKGVKT